MYYLKDKQDAETSAVKSRYVCIIIEKDEDEQEEGGLIDRPNASAWYPGSGYLCRPLEACSSIYLQHFSTYFQGNQSIS